MCRKFAKKPIIRYFIFRIKTPLRINIVALIKAVELDEKEFLQSVAFSIRQGI